MAIEFELKEGRVIVVTGGSGYIGSRIVKRLVERGKAVRALVRSRRRAENEGRLRGLPVEWIEADVTRPETLGPAMQGASAVIHTVAIAVEKGGRKYEPINYQGTVNVVEAAKAAGVRRFINQCQLGADSKLPYRFLASKGKAQEYVATSGLDWTAFRPSVVWGPEDEFANTFARLVPITPIIYPIIGDGQARFEPVWVEDVVTCFEKALDDPATIGTEYELGGPEVLTLAEIERRTLEAVGARRMMVPLPLPLVRIVVTLMETLLPAPPVTRSLLELLAVSNVTTANAIGQFVSDPRPFTPENCAPYMRQFRLGETIAQFTGR
ncbi:MAG: complex I NDUFA9 subunit family protein [Chloroflexi bacterium]|nr:complex I NDUFA9 subunit family protein [Chloroflexota bacterium]